MSAVQLARGVHPLNDPITWLRDGGYDPPLSQTEHDNVQREIDSIIGITRDNKSIATLVWNGDVRYWQQFFDEWDAFGKPVGGLKSRPWVLFKTVLDSRGNFVRDAFVPRYLLLTRQEPEQYYDTWDQTASFFHPEKGCMVRYQPYDPPKDLYMWYRTIAEHRGGCCQRQAQEDDSVNCFGLYAHPRECLDELRDIRRRMDAEEKPKNHPFDSLDQINARLRLHSINNYAEQAMRKYDAASSIIVDQSPLVFASSRSLETGTSLAQARAEAKERLKYGQDALERELRRKGAI